MKYVTMELGGKSACVILPDADVDQAVDGAMLANFFSTGQVCTNGTRVFIPESIKSDFEKRLLEKMQYIRPGDLHDPATNFGPLVSKPHYDKVIQYIKHGRDNDKAKLLCGGTRLLTKSSSVQTPPTWVLRQVSSPRILISRIKSLLNWKLASPGSTRGVRVRLR